MNRELLANLTGNYFIRNIASKLLPKENYCVVAIAGGYVHIIHTAPDRAAASNPHSVLQNALVIHSQFTVPVWFAAGSRPTCTHTAVRATKSSNFTHQLRNLVRRGKPAALHAHSRQGHEIQPFHSSTSKIVVDVGGLRCERLLCEIVRKS